MIATSSGPTRHGAAAVTGAMARRLAGAALGVLVAAAVLFAGAWLIGGEDAVSDNWVGITVMLAFFVGLFGALAALVIAVVAGFRHEPWHRLWLPLMTVPAVVAIVVVLETFIFE